MYTINMVFATAEKALKPRSEQAKIVAWVLAGLLVVMVIAQLYAFEDFIPLISINYFPSSSYGLASLVGCLIVLCEVFALPFLLRMALSPLMRWFSLVCSVAAPLLWLGLTFFAIISNQFVDNYGLLGSKVHLHTGWVALVVATVLSMLALWSAWNLLPSRKK
jgi:hypothetical protein